VNRWFGKLKLAIVLAAFAVGCGPFGDDVEGSLEELGDAIRQAREGGKPFRLSSATRFDWDRVYFFSPSSSPARVRRALGFDWEQADDSNVGSDDSVSLVVFVRDGRVERAFDHQVDRGDLRCLSVRVLRRPGLDRRDAVLRVERVRSGGRRRDLVILTKPRGRGEARSIARCVRRRS
jgi:hypothetical protein